jgi:hypothetical protein
MNNLLFYTVLVIQNCLSECVMGVGVAYLLLSHNGQVRPHWLEFSPVAGTYILLVVAVFFKIFDAVSR